jgi:hypothetical protein
MVTPRLDLPANHILAKYPLNGVSPQEVTAGFGEEQLDNALAGLPETWCTDLGMAPRALVARLREYFGRIGGM